MRKCLVSKCGALLALCLSVSWLARGAEFPWTAPRDLPCASVRDFSAFTVDVKVRLGDLTDRKPYALLKQLSTSTGWVLGLVRMGDKTKVEVCCNGAYFPMGFITDGKPEHRLTLTARKGVLVVYLDEKPLRRLFKVITPNLVPVTVGAAPELQVESLEFHGPDYEYYAPGEPHEYADGYTGGVGWLAACPVEKPGVRLPRILCYGDSVLAGYGSRLRKVLEGRAYVYWWNAYVQDPLGEKVPPRCFREAATLKKFDYIIFNNGLHSLHWTEDKVSDELLKATQRQILRNFRDASPESKVYWLSTTPHASTKFNAQGKVDAVGELNDMVLRINRLTAEVMAEEKVPVIDGYGFFANRLHFSSGDAYHWTGEGYVEFSKMIAREIGL